MSWFKNIRLLTKIRLFISLLFTLMFLISGAFLFFTRKSQITNEYEDKINTQIAELESVINSYLKRDKDLLNLAVKIADHKINENSEIIESPTKEITIKAVDPFTNKSIELKLNEWRVDGFPLLNNYMLADQLASLTKLDVSIYQKCDKGYVNVSTSILSLAKERMTGDILLKSSPIVETIEQGNQFSGRVFQNNAWYNTSYKPLYIDGKIKGLYYLGIRERMGRALMNVFESKKFLKSGYPFLITKEGTILIHPEEKQGADYSKTSIFKKLNSSNLNSGTIRYKWPNEKHGQQWNLHYKYHEPTQSYICIGYPKSELYNELIIYSVYGFIGFIIFIIVLQFFFGLAYKPLKRRLNRLKSILTHLAEGQNTDMLKLPGEREFYELGEKVNQISGRFNDLAEFANGLANDNFSQVYPKSFIDDKIGEALILINDKLNEAMYNENIRKKEDKLRDWESEGLSRFVNILQRNRENLDELCYELISNLVEYLNADLGALFFINADDPEDIYFEQMATYAFEQRRLVQKKIYPEQGLIGRIFNEKETIYLSEVPKGYITIKSGLGEGDPKNLLIVPLLINKEVYGAIEIASFNLIKGFQIEFIEKIGENIASTINNVLVNTKTKELLQQSRKQSELLSSQEEEMRRNILELQNIQKESDASIYAQKDLFKSIDDIVLIIEMNATGEIIFVNDLVPQFFAMTKENLEGKHYSDYSNYVPVDEYKNLIVCWEKITKGENVQTDLKVKSGKGSMSSIFVSIIPKMKDDKVERVILMGIELQNKA
jgi:PAS domain-containing protein